MLASEVRVLRDRSLPIYASTATRRRHRGWSRRRRARLWHGMLRLVGVALILSTTAALALGRLV